MAPLIELSQASKSYGNQILLDDVSLTLDDTQKVGLIGRNGAGKSTLARILLGEEDLDTGKVIRHRALRLGYLYQHDPFEPEESILAFLMRDSGQPEWRCGEVAGRFELKGESLNEPVRQLSGGWQSRVKLAGLLLHEPNLLLLDEPTNFLDLSTQILLERFLRTFPAGCLVISHDRAFLNATCEHTIELSRGNLARYPGKVDAYLEYKKLQQEQDQQTNVRTLAKRKQLQSFVDRNRAGANTASQARNKQKQIERLELIRVESAEATVGMRLQVCEQRRGTALRCDDLSIGYPDHTVATEIRLDLEHGERIAIVGDNSQGKTTFLKTVTESIPTLAGAFRWGHGCVIGVYAQHVFESLPEMQTVRGFLVNRAAPGITTQEVLNVAGSFLFRGEAVNKDIRVLSGGERARVCLAGLFLRGHNILILDEPVNHLDVETADELADALARYTGTVIFTSHDRAFMSKVATQVVEVRDGKIDVYRGDYSLYVERMRQRIEENEGSRPPPPTRAAAQAKAKAKQPGTKNSAKERFRLEKKINSLERQMNKQKELLPALLEKMTAAVDDWQVLSDLQKEQKVIEARINVLETEWLEGQEQLEAL